jgi:phosphoribosylamine---glycine ligase
VTILIIGSGAREHALAWKFSKSNRLAGLFAAPGNAGTAAVANNLDDVDPVNAESVLRACRDNDINMVFVGPEAPLAAGVADALTEAGIPVVGPHAKAARLESSKSHSKSFMKNYRIPTAAYRSFSDAAACAKYIRRVGHRVVVKKSGLAAGKGVLESDDQETLINFANDVIAAGDEVVVEERLVGYEVSVFALSDGSSHILLPPCTDYKKAGANGTGPNTGGMGAICPVPWLKPDEMSRIETEIVARTFDGLKDAGLSYVGVVYFGIMMTDDGPRLLEYNVRFGDPEAQVVIPLIKTDFANLTEAMTQGGLSSFPLRYHDASALGVVVAAPGYPGSYPKGIPVTSIPRDVDGETLVFHASTRRDGETVVTGGGRCFTVVGLGREFLAARNRAYGAARNLHFEGGWFRPDIGGRIFGS